MAINIALIIILGLCADYLFRSIRLPGLIGMLLVGVLVGPYIMNLISPEMTQVSGEFRQTHIAACLSR